MKYQELISYEKKYGECKNDLLVIIPCFIDYDLLARHLGYLSRQTFHNFDVILILGPNFNDSRLFDFLKGNRFDFGIILVKNKNIGTTCSFFIGQKYGYGNGYNCMINADDDCMPVDPNVVGALYSKRGIGCVYPTQRLIFGNKCVGFEKGCTNHYALFSRPIFEKYGFYYLPIYHGSEDSEFKERIKNEKSCTVPNFVEHPNCFSGNSAIKNPPKPWIYMVSDLMVKEFNIPYLIGAILYFCALSSLSLFFIPIYGADLFVAMMGLLFSYKLGKETYAKVEGSIPKTVFLLKKDIPNNPEIMDDSSASYLEKGSVDKLLNMIRESVPCFRKEILIENSYSLFKVFMLCCVCKKVYLKRDADKYILLSNNSNILFHILRILALPFFMALYFLIFIAAFIPLKIIKQPRTMGYGLDEKQQ